MKIKRIRALIFLAMMFFSPFITKSALADHSDPFVQVTCAPEIDYLFIRTFHLADLPRMWDEEHWKSIKNAIIKNGIYDLKDFTEANYHCDLPTHNISFDLKQYLPMERGKCYENNAAFSIKIDGESVYDFDTFGTHCENTAHQISFQHITGHKGYDKLFIRDCIYPEGEFYTKKNPSNAEVCKDIGFPPSTVQQ